MSQKIPNYAMWQETIIIIVENYRAISQQGCLISNVFCEHVVVPFRMAMGNEELVHKYFPKHLHMG